MTAEVGLGSADNGEKPVISTEAHEERGRKPVISTEAHEERGRGVEKTQEVRFLATLGMTGGVFL
jgi:hypothetical protein